MTTPEDRELLRAGWGAFNDRDPDALAALCTPDVEVGSLLTAADGEIRHGHEGIRELFAQQDEAFSYLHAEVREPERHGDWILTEGTMRGRGRASEADVEVHFVQITRTEGGLVAAWRFLRSRDEAEATLAALDQTSSAGAPGRQRSPE